MKPASKRQTKYMQPARKFVNENDEVFVQSHLEVELLSADRVREAKEKDRETFQREMELEMLACIEVGNTAGVFAIARGKQYRKTFRALSAAQKKKMEQTHKDLIGKPHATEPPDESRWKFPVINLAPSDKDRDRPTIQMAPSTDKVSMQAAKDS